MTMSWMWLGHPKRYVFSVLRLVWLLSRFSHVWHFVTLWAVACQAPLSMGFSRQEYWSGCHYVLQRIFPTQGLNPHQDCILSPCLFNLYAEYIMRNAGMEEAQAGIKIAGRNINNLRYTNDTTLMAESEEELKSLLMKWKWRVKKLA